MKQRGKNLRESGNLKEQGVVVDAKNNNFIAVRIGRNSACASCGKCGMTEKQKHVDFLVENTQNAVVGDTVLVEIPETNAAPLAFVGYILPLIPALALLFLGIGLKLPDWASLLMFVGGLIAGFALVVLIEKLRKHKWVQSPTLVEIVRRSSAAQTSVSSDAATEHTSTPSAQNLYDTEQQSKVEKEQKDE